MVYLPELETSSLSLTPVPPGMPATTDEVAEAIPEPTALPADVALPEHGAIGLPLATPPSDATEAQEQDQNAHLVSYLGPPQLRVFGTIQLIRKRYLHLDLDLLYRPEASRLLALLPEDWPHRPGKPSEALPADESGEPLGPKPTATAVSEAEPEAKGEGQAEEEPQVDPWSVDGFRLKQSRRIRAGELHYFDHPLFGVLARVKQIEPPGSSQDQQEEAPGAFPGAPAP